ncbi:MAG: hypothetical protein CSB55_01280 [Candidatus Cloacimonadota bacterium]|nr:MAG: hypothetical protein CSB55_01280 [Candidatus Cloacimonadota bacterium]
MKNTLGMIFNVIGWIVLLACLGSLGFLSGNPKKMVPLYTLFFIACFAASYIWQKTHKKHNLEQSKGAVLVKKVIGAVLVIGAIVTPYRIFNSLWPGFFAGFFGSQALMLTGITLVLILASLGAVLLINKNKGVNNLLAFVGYLLLIVISTCPGFIMKPLDSSYNALGQAYNTALLVAILAWWGFSLVTGKTEE